MTIAKETSGNTLTVRLDGRLDTITSPDLEQALSDLAGVAHLVLDFAGISYISSAGLRVLLLLYRQAVARNGRVALAGVADTIKDTMAVTGFLKFFTVADTVAQALTTLQQQA